MSQYLSTENYRGTRDFYPDDQRLRHFITTRIRGVLESFGFENYDGPFLESLELYAAKSSAEIVNEQLYTLTDRSQRQLALRPEMTPTLARMVAKKAGHLSKPLRWYSSPVCMRYERQQRGRLREFEQLNVDILGADPLAADVEIVLTLAEILFSLGATASDFKICINHRGLINLFFKEHLGWDPTHSSSTHLMRLLDKRDKLTQQQFEAGLGELGMSGPQADNIQRFLVLGVDELQDFFAKDGPAPTVCQQLVQRIQLLQGLLPKGCIQFQPTILRGFDYYTSFVFEVFDTHEDNRRALCGGGRYDDLVSAFGAPALSGVGYGISDVSFLNFLQSHNLSPTFIRKIDLCVVHIQEQAFAQGLMLARDLRAVGLCVDMSLQFGKFGKQIAAAQRMKACAIAFCGEEERAKGTFAVKWLSTGQQETFPYTASSFQQVAQQILNYKG